MEAPLGGSVAFPADRRALDAFRKLVDADTCEYLPPLRAVEGAPVTIERIKLRRRRTT